MVDLSGFLAKLQRFEEVDLPAAIERKVDALGEELLTRVKDNTPVASGAAKDAWELTLSGQGYSRAARLTNPLPYVAALEQGASPQAPDGIVAPSIAEMKGGSR